MNSYLIKIITDALPKMGSKLIHWEPIIFLPDSVLDTKDN